MSEVEKKLLEVLGELIEATMPRDDYHVNDTVLECLICHSECRPARGEKMSHDADCAWDKAVHSHALYDPYPTEPCED